MHRLSNLFIAPLSLAMLAGCQSAQPSTPRDHAAGPPPLYDGLGAHHRKITTSSEQAQRYFDQGLVWSYAFNHDEAIRAFAEAARLDPGCAMAWWGVALCNGPHINNPAVPPDRAKAAWDALQRAMALRSAASPTERGLIEALAKRYADPPPAYRQPLDALYAEAMHSVWEAHRGDDDVAVLYAEALMDLQPWDLWDRKGRPKGETLQILAVLEEVLARSPDHPGACHLYIHAQEAGPTPEKADAAATQLRTLVPASGHLTHMPTHIDLQLGRWAQAADQNLKAIDADRRYRRLSPQQGFYNVYMAHNHHFLAFASMMEGRSAVALQAARDLIAAIPPDFAKEQPGLADPFMTLPLDVLKRFGRWDDVLREPAPPANLPISTAMWHYARGVALAAKGDVAGAEREQIAFRAAADRVPPGTMMSINPAAAALAIATDVLKGEIAFRKGNIDAAVSSLRDAVTIEDYLIYMEPPDWMQPARHTLGAVLVSAKRYAEAEQVYREDLRAWPENGWSLHGLELSLRGQGKSGEAEDVAARFAKTWERADVKIGSSCLCVPGEAVRASSAR